MNLASSSLLFHATGSTYSEFYIKSWVDRRVSRGDSGKPHRPLLPKLQTFREQHCRSCTVQITLRNLQDGNREKLRSKFNRPVRQRTRCGLRLSRIFCVNIFWVDFVYKDKEAVEEKPFLSPCRHWSYECHEIQRFLGQRQYFLRESGSIKKWNVYTAVHDCNL